MSGETAVIRQTRLSKNWPSSGAPVTINFVCECSHADCAAQLELSRTAYEQVRAHPARFVVAPGHEILEVDAVMDTLGSYVIVEKIGAAEVVAIETDPRANN